MMVRSQISEIYERFTAHYGDLTNYLTSKVDSRDEANDIAQDTFLRVIKVKRPEKVKEPRSFIFRTALNVLIDRRRKHATRSKYLTEIEEIEHICDSQPTPYQRLAREECQALLQETVASLPPKCQRVFILNRYGHLSYTQISQKLGISKSTVEKHMMRALAACRSALDQAIERDYS